MSRIVVDLTKAPSIASSLSQRRGASPTHQQWVTVPDVHGNVMLLSYHLHYCQIIQNNSVVDDALKFVEVTSDISETDSSEDEAPPWAYNKKPSPPPIKINTSQQKTPHEKLAALYKEHALLIAQHQNATRDFFKNILSGDLKNNINAFKKLVDVLVIGNDPLNLRLLGDVLADRGANDYLTLLMLQFLHNKNVPFEIIFSNHDAVFMQAFLKNKLNGLNGITTLQNVSSSLENLSYLLSENIVQKSEVKELVETCYLPHLKLISYDVYEEEGHQKIKYYTHAPVDYEVIRDMAIKLGVVYQDDTMDDFCNTLDEINAAFSEKKEFGELGCWMEEEDVIRRIVEDAIALNAVQSQETLLDEKEKASDVFADTSEKILNAFVENTAKTQLTPEEKNAKISEICDEFASDVNTDDEEECAYQRFMQRMSDGIIDMPDMPESQATADFIKLLNSIPQLFGHYRRINDEYEKSLDKALQHPHHIQEAPLNTFLWSRIKIVFDKVRTDNMHIFLDTNGNQYHCRTQYRLSTEGWKEYAINCHGHAGPDGDVVYFDSKSDDHENLDASHLGKRYHFADQSTHSVRIEENDQGELIQRYSENIRPPQHKITVTTKTTKLNSAKFFQSCFVLSPSGAQFKVPGGSDDSPVLRKPLAKK